MQYQHDSIFALLLFCSETSDKNNYLTSDQFLMRKILFSNFHNNEYDINIETDIIFHAMSGANDVIKVDIM